MDNEFAPAESLVDRFRRWYAMARGTIGPAERFQTPDDAAVTRMAQDHGMPEERLRSLVRNGPHAADEMLMLMRLLHIDPAEVRLADPAEFREMQTTCSQCSEKSRCRRGLMDGDGWADFPAYCDNAGRLNEMRADPKFSLE